MPSSPSTTRPTRSTRSSPAPWATALVVLPLVAALVSILLRNETVASAFLPPEHGAVPLELLGAAWLIVPVAVLVLLLVTVRPDGAPRRPARAVALVATAWLGTVTYVLTPTASDSGYQARTFGAAAGRVEAVEHGVLLGLLGVVAAVVLTAVVMVAGFRKPADLDGWSVQRQEDRTRTVGRRLGLTLLGLLLVALGVVGVVVT